LVNQKYIRIEHFQSLLDILNETIISLTDEERHADNPEIIDCRYYNLLNVKYRLEDLVSAVKTEMVDNNETIRR
jgi:outer membrane phospholipase A